MTIDPSTPAPPDEGVKITLSLGKDVLAGWTRHGLSIGGGALAAHSALAFHNKTQTLEESLGSFAIIAAALGWSAFKRINDPPAPKG